MGRGGLALAVIVLPAGLIRPKSYPPGTILG